MASGGLRAADWLGELNASTWLGELPSDEPIRYRIPPRPAVSRHHRDLDNAIPPEPEFEDEAPPVPNCPPPRVGNAMNAGWYEMLFNKKGEPPALRLAPPSEMNRGKRKRRDIWFDQYTPPQHYAPAAFNVGISSSKSQPDLALQDSALRAWPPARSRDAITIVKPSINATSTPSISSKPQLEPDLAVRHPTLQAWPLARNSDLKTIANPSSNTSSTSTTAGNSINACIDENGAANGDKDKEVFRCTGQCGKQWSSWEQVPHWSKSSRPRKPWCQDCGNDKLGPWNEWGSN